MDSDVKLNAYEKCLEELAAMEERVERYLQQNDTARGAMLMTELMDLARRLRESRDALTGRTLQ